MASFFYEARDGRGQTVRGSHDAPSREEALQFLRGQGLFLTKLEATKKSFSPPYSSEASTSASQKTSTPRVPISQTPQNTQAPRSDGANGAFAETKTTRHSAPAPLAEQPFVRASKRDLSLFFRQLASAIHAGVSLGAALSTLSKHGENPAIARMAAQLAPRVQGGEPISVGMKAFPGLFTPLMLGITRAGEKGGALEGAFSRLADYAERDYALETAVKRETFYPKILVFASIFIPAVVPLVLQGPGAAFRQILPPLLIVGGATLAWRSGRFLGPQALRKSGLSLQFDALKLRLPVAGKITRGLATAKFCRALGALYGAGVSPVESLQLSALSCGNEVLERRAVSQTPALMEGLPLSELLANTGVFHPMALQMLKVGEDTGNIDGQLEKAADFLESDAETAIKQAIPILGVLVFLAVAAYIGYIIITSYGGRAAQINELIDAGG